MRHGMGVKVGQIDFEVTGHVGHIVLNNPTKRNAVDADMIDSLHAVYDDIAKSREIRAVVISGQGQEAFCTGGYIPSYVHGGIVGEEGTGRRNVLPKPWRIYKPFIAAIEGYCVGGGFALALTCDLRVASSAIRIGASGLKRGVMNASGHTTRLVRLIGISSAIDLLLTSRYIDGDEAYRINLVQRLTEPGEAVPTALALAEALARFSPEAVAATKRIVYDNLDLTWDEALAWEEELTAENYRTPDAMEGYASFLERREAHFGQNNSSEGPEMLGLTRHWPRADAPVWRG
jgi:enoyl-CoA hydratase/carnithine racemase